MRLAQISGLAASHAAPLSSLALGSVGEPSGARDEHVATIEGALECFEDAEAVRAPVNLAVCELRVGEHEALPLAADELQRNRCGADASRAALDGAQRVAGVSEELCRHERTGVSCRRTHTAEAGSRLSLIHISEPTRPY